MPVVERDDTTRWNLGMRNPLRLPMAFRSPGDRLLGHMPVWGTVSGSGQALHHGLPRTMAFGALLACVGTVTKVMEQHLVAEKGSHG